MFSIEKHFSQCENTLFRMKMIYVSYLPYNIVENVFLIHVPFFSNVRYVIEYNKKWLRASCMLHTTVTYSGFHSEGGLK